MGLDGQYTNPVRVVSFNTAERWSQDVSGDVTSTGQVLVSTNSGTNLYHGQLFGYFQDQRAGFANTAGGNNSPFQRNQFGGRVGGPIIKDKLFFFGNSERIKQDQSQSLTLGPDFQTIQTKYSKLPSPYRETYSTPPTLVSEDEPVVQAACRAVRHRWHR